MMDLFTASRLNTDRLKGQNRRLLDYLSQGHTIHCMHPAMKELRIGYLNSRASDLINKNNIHLYKRRIEVQDTCGEAVTVVEYSLNPF